MSPALVPPSPATLAATLADGAVLKTSSVARYDGRETMRIVDGDIDDTDVIRDLIAFHLFTWRRARPDDVVPDGASRQGWFADPEFGSRLWLLQSRKVDANALVDARQYAEEALAPLIAQGILATVAVAADRVSDTPGGIGLAISYTRPKAPGGLVRYDTLWS